MKQTRINMDFPRMALSLLLIIFILIALLQGQSPLILFSDFIKRVGMNGVLVLAMLPGILGGIGLNFGLSIGILCGLFGGCLSIEMGLNGGTAFFIALVISIVCSIIFGIVYGVILNKLKGSEMTVGTYLGFSAVSLLSIGWTLLPFHNPEMIWAIGGKGLRTTISLTGHFEGILDRFFSVSFLGKELSVGTLCFFLLLCFFTSVFLKTKKGIALKASGENPDFAKGMGINVDYQRILAATLSTILGGVGILVYSQGYGFMQLYQAPLMMPFSSVAAVLIGGASVRRVSVGNVIIGVVFLQLFMSVSVPVISKILPDSSLSESLRMIITYGAILFALTKQKGDSK